ncbi:hypothetical protein [Nitrosomonas halophila]|uniref:EF hand n=1 Tax=Nitrosomonas halophila TaxID=44576 RepID=A0A1H3M2W5_9PROT|nr:hypothetical protein [Nitrosomonas halophila]SDY70644.1 EF hand [Nitrosomonas halophila]
MYKRKSIIYTAVSSTFAVTLGIAPLASAAENPFSLQPMEKGFMVAYGDEKAGEGKCGEKKCGATMADTNKDGKVSREEWDKHHDAMFEEMDVNKDGVIDKDEIEKSKAEKRKMRGDKKNY